MAITDGSFPPPPPLPRRGGAGPVVARILGLGVGVLLVLGLIFAGSFWYWFFWRIEPGPGEIVILIKKSGKDLAPDEIIAPTPSHKGIQLNVLSEGRHFRNPLLWDWERRKIVDIPAGKLGVRTRLYGRDLPPGKVIAQGDDTKGILADVLMPGKHQINPFAYDLQQYDAISIRPGSVGVVTSLIGQDVLSDLLPTNVVNSFTVPDQFKGVQQKVLDPGTHYLNPFVVNVVEVNLQSQRFVMGGEDAINFLTNDGFSVTVEGTVEFSLLRDRAALLTHRVGDMEDVLNKVILPRARGFSRIEGSKYPATAFIVGETRQKFQDNLEEHLRAKCREWGVDIKSLLIRNIVPPDEIAQIIREREIAVQNALKFEQQILQARSKAELTRQEMLAEQNKEKGEAETAQLRATISAQQQMAVRTTEANRELEVTKLDGDAVKAQVAAQIATAEAERDVIRMGNEAQASVISNRVQAFGNGFNLARHEMFQKLGPRIGSILASDEPGGIGDLLRAFNPGAAATPVALPPVSPPPVLRASPPAAVPAPAPAVAPLSTPLSTPGE